MRYLRYIPACAVIAVACGHPAAAEDLLSIQGLTGRPGGRLVYAQRTEPKTLNPVVAADSASREVIHRMQADLIHINRQTQRTEPALARSWSVSPDGMHYTLELRRGLRFSDGHPFDAGDVVFTFQVLLDEKVHSPQRDLLFLDGKPLAVRQLGSYRVAFDLPKPYAAAERLFDGFAILPRHRLEAAWKQGKLGEAWGLRSPPSDIAVLGPFRLKEYSSGQRVVLERNPYYWKTDTAGNRLPYLSEVHFVFAGTEDMQVLRFQSGESDIISRLSARNFAVLEKAKERARYNLQDPGPGLEYSFLFFNLGKASSPEVAARQGVFQREVFRRAVSAAIDRDAIVKLVYAGRAIPLAGPVPAGSKAWVNTGLPAPARSVPRARDLLASAGFSWTPSGALRDPQGKAVEFSIITSAGNPERIQMATLIQDDLKQLGIQAHIAPLEFRSLLDRVLRTRDYEACLLSLVSGDADPNADMNVWLSSGGTHLWNPEQKSPATPWEAEIDGLMAKQMYTRRYADRKRLFDRVQEIAAEHLPLIPLVSPHVLAGSKAGLANFRPALLDHYTLWNVEELYWRAAGAAGKP